MNVLSGIPTLDTTFPFVISLTIIILNISQAAEFFMTNFTRFASLRNPGLEASRRPAASAAQFWPDD